MANISRNDYLASIEESASFICSEIGPDVVDSVFQRYGAHSVEDLTPVNLPEVFSELYAIEADLR